MGFHVRQALPDDREAILEIANALHPEWFTELGIEDIAKDLQIEQALVAVDDERVVGFVIYCVAKDGKTAELSWIAVRPELHRRGIGRAMIEVLQAILTEQGILALEVSTVAPTIEREPYARTLNFYSAMDFSYVRIDKEWYATGVDRLLLRKILSRKTMPLDRRLKPSA